YLAVLGVDKIPLDLGLEISLDPKNRSGSLEMTMAGRDIAAIKWSAEFASLDPNLLRLSAFRNLSELKSGFSGNNLLLLLVELPEIIRQAGAVELVSVAGSWR